MKRKRKTPKASELKDTMHNTQLPIIILIRYIDDDGFASQVETDKWCRKPTIKQARAYLVAECAENNPTNVVVDTIGDE